MLTLDEIRNVTFTKSMGGYKTSEVDAFIDDVADTVQATQNELAETNKKMGILADKLMEYRNDEDTIRQAMMSAQRLSDTTVREATQKAEQILQEAQDKADKLLVDAKIQSENIKGSAQDQISDQIHGLDQIKREVADFKRQLLSIYSDHVQLINSLPAERNYAMDRSVVTDIPPIASIPPIAAIPEPMIPPVEEKPVPPVRQPVEDAIPSRHSAPYVPTEYAPPPVPVEESIDIYSMDPDKLRPEEDVIPEPVLPHRSRQPEPEYADEDITLFRGSPDNSGYRGNVLEMEPARVSRPVRLEDDEPPVATIPQDPSGSRQPQVSRFDDLRFGEDYDIGTPLSKPRRKK